MSAFFFRVSGVFDQLLRTGRAQLKFLIKSHKTRSFHTPVHRFVNNYVLAFKLFLTKCRELYRKSGERSRGDFLIRQREYWVDNNSFFLILFPNALAVHLELLFNNFCGLLNSQQCIFIRTLITFVDYLVFSSASSFT